MSVGRDTLGHCSAVEPLVQGGKFGNLRLTLNVKERRTTPYQKSHSKQQCSAHKDGSTRPHVRSRQSLAPFIAPTRRRLVRFEFIFPRHVLAAARPFRELHRAWHFAFLFQLGQLDKAVVEHQTSQQQL